jgi:hypothetical protein
MRARASALTGHSGRGVWPMTFHSACARILRRDGHALGYTPAFTIYDTADSRRVIKRLLGATAGEDSEQAGGGARGVHAEISAAKNQMLSVEQWLSRQPHPDLAGTTAEVWRAYDAELRRANARHGDLRAPRPGSCSATGSPMPSGPARRPRRREMLSPTGAIRPPSHDASRGSRPPARGAGPAARALSPAAPSSDLRRSRRPRAAPRRAPRAGRRLGPQRLRRPAA